MIRKFGLVLCLCFLAFPQALEAQDSLSAATRCRQLMDDRPEFHEYGITPIRELLTKPKLRAEALQVCRQAHEGDPENLEFLRLLGLAVVIDERVNNKPITGVQYIFQSAEGGDLKSQQILGRAYSRGLFGEEDASKAFQWYQRAAENGDPKAQAEIGVFIIEGIGTEKDIDKGIAYLERAAAEGNVFAHSTLGVLLYAGNGVPKDQTRGLQHLEIAAAAEVPGAMMFLGMLLMFSDFDATADYENSVDVLRGLEMAKKAAERGQIYSAAEVARFYDIQVQVLTRENPERVPEMEKERLYWTCKAGEIGQEFYPEIYAQCSENAGK